MSCLCLLFCPACFDRIAIIALCVVEPAPWRSVVLCDFFFSACLATGTSWVLVFALRCSLHEASEMYNRRGFCCVKFPWLATRLIFTLERLCNGDEWFYRLRSLFGCAVRSPQSMVVVALATAQELKGNGFFYVVGSYRCCLFRSWLVDRQSGPSLRQHVYGHFWSLYPFCISLFLIFPGHHCRQADVGSGSRGTKRATN